MAPRPHCFLEVAPLSSFAFEGAEYSYSVPCTSVEPSPHPLLFDTRPLIVPFPLSPLFLPFFISPFCCILRTLATNASITTPHAGEKETTLICGALSRLRFSLRLSLSLLSLPASLIAADRYQKKNIPYSTQHTTHTTQQQRRKACGTTVRSIVFRFCPFIVLTASFLFLLAQLVRFALHCAIKCEKRSSNERTNEKDAIEPLFPWWHERLL